MASVLSTRMRETIDARAVAQLIAEHYHCSARLADAIAAGALSRTVDAKALARRWGLICIDTDEARKKGLLR